MNVDEGKLSRDCCADGVSRKFKLWNESISIWNRCFRIICTILFYDFVRKNSILFYSYLNNLNIFN